MAASDPRLLASLLGIAAHLMVFRVGEWDAVSLDIGKIHMLSFSLVALLMRARHDVPLLASAQCFGCYVASIYLSMIIYRAFFHRLRDYPGPFLAKLSTFYVTAKIARRYDLFLVTEKLHRQHGDYVRLGPNELSITDPEAVRAIYGAQSPTAKGPFYLFTAPRLPVINVRDKTEHARRRKIWDRGFSTQALNGYDRRVSRMVDDLVNIIASHQNKPINITRWISFFAFDVISDVAFSESLNLLRDDRDEYVFEAIRKDEGTIMLLSRIPWIAPFFKVTPVLNRSYLKFYEWLQNQLDRRLGNEPDQPDIFSSIIEDFQQGQMTKTDRLNLHGDVQLAIVAGSDSVSSTLVHIFYYLAADADLAQRLQIELDALPSLIHENLTKVNLLDGIIHETLRLHPVVPSGLQRVTPPEGLNIGDRHIPGNTVVQVPMHTTFRDPRAFEKPLDFVPERWTMRPELIKDSSVYMPFSLGSYNCAGKRLAMMEMRFVIARLLFRYDVRLAPGQTEKAFLDGKKDTYTLAAGQLNLVFTSREKRV